MKSTKKELENVILYFAEKYGQEKNYRAIIESNTTMPKLIQMIVYDMFLNKFNSYYCSDEDYENYKIIHEYVNELHINGYVFYKK